MTRTLTSQQMVKQRPRVTSGIKTTLPDGRVSYNSVVERRSLSPLHCTVMLTGVISDHTGRWDASGDVNVQRHHSIHKACCNVTYYHRKIDTIAVITHSSPNLCVAKVNRRIYSALYNKHFIATALTYCAIYSQESLE